MDEVFFLEELDRRKVVKEDIEYLEFLNYSVRYRTVNVGY